jgi:ABC-type multidrug transport system fused ATPase/permease subunit
VLVLTPLAVFEALSGVPAAAAHLGTARAALARVFALLDRPDPVAEPAHPAHPPRPPATLRLNGITARWNTDGPDVVRDIDLTIEPGQRIAIVGPSGSGKTTLAALLVRFLDPSSGTITLGGVNLRELASDRLREIVGLVDDRAYLFDTTIEDNLRIGRRDASPDQLRRALHAARLDDWIGTLPLGLSTLVGEHGARLSGGQQRRLALARALLKRPSSPPALTTAPRTTPLRRSTAAG